MGMAKVSNAVELLRKIWTAWVGCTSVTDRRQTDRRQTDGRQHIANVNSRSRSLNLHQNNRIGYSNAILFLNDNCLKYITVSLWNQILDLPCTTCCIQDLSTTFSPQQFYDPLLILTRATLSASNVGLPNTSSFAIGVLVSNTFCCYSKRASTVNTVYHSVRSKNKNWTRKLYWPAATDVAVWVWTGSNNWLIMWN